MSEANNNIKTKSGFQAKLSWLDKTTFELQITIPKKQIKEAYQKVLNSLASSVDISGFRKGKAPLNLTEEKLGKEKIYQRVIEELIPQAYLEALKKHSLSPVLQPKIELVSAQEAKDWKIKATSCQAPKIILKNWRLEIKKLNAGQKIWTPDKKEKSSEKEKETEKQKQLIKIMAKIQQLVMVEIPSFWVKTEQDKRLTSLIDQLQTAGLTLHEYLGNKGTTIEKLKEQFQQEIKSQLQTELALEKIADQAEIKVEQEEIDQLMKRTPEEQRKKINPYLLAQIIRRQKTIDYLLNL